MKLPRLPKHFFNVVFLMLGLSVAFVSSWQIDIVAAGVISAFYEQVKTWRLWMPTIPPFSWEATYWTWPDAYVRFFILLWAGFMIALFALWFWEDEKPDPTFR